MEEYICLCTSVTEDNRSVSVAVNRATPSREAILEVFGDRVDEDTLILCEGNKSYDVLETQCRVATSKSVNKVNGFHSFIKERNRRARGFATSYLNRYSTLFSKIFANHKTAVDEIYKLMTRQGDHFNGDPIKSTYT
jgi:transposase-like protein